MSITDNDFNILAKLRCREEGLAALLLLLVLQTFALSPSVGENDFIPPFLWLCFVLSIVFRCWIIQGCIVPADVLVATSSRKLDTAVRWRRDFYEKQLRASVYYFTLLLILWKIQYETCAVLVISPKLFWVPVASSHYGYP